MYANNKKHNIHKNKWIKTMLLTAVLFLISAFIAAASAEENGYWTEKVDSEGRIVRIFTYTEPVDITFDEKDGYGCLPEDAEQVAVAENGPVHMAGAGDSNTQESGLDVAEQMPAGTHGMGSVFILGGLLLVILGAALYKTL